MEIKNPAARKRFGQNFLVDANIIDRIVAAVAPGAADNLVEIGPGRGALTGLLLDRLDHLTAIELDRDLAALLTQTFAESDRFSLVQGDALRFDFASLAGHGPLRVVGNLPYNISTPLIFHLLGVADLIQDMHFMLQKEVVDRMAAAPGNKSYGRLSVIVQYHCRVISLFDVPPTAFRPVPKVTSAVVRLVPRAAPVPTATNTELFYRLVKAAFQQRRKTLRNTLKHFVADLGDISLDLSRRPETLSVAEFVELSNQLDNRET